MKKNDILRVLVLTMFYLNNGLASGVSDIGEISKVEKEKRHIVSRMYQATYGMLQICPDKEVDSFKKIIAKFEERYPEFSKLLNESKYHQYAVDNMRRDITHERKQSDKARIPQCSFGKSMTKSLTNTDSGKKSVAEMLEKLQK